MKTMLYKTEVGLMKIVLYRNSTYIRWLSYTMDFACTRASAQTFLRPDVLIRLALIHVHLAHLPLPSTSLISFRAGSLLLSFKAPQRHSSFCLLFNLYYCSSLSCVFPKLLHEYKSMKLYVIMLTLIQSLCELFDREPWFCTWIICIGT